MSAVSTSTRVHRYLHYDVFTDTTLTGNQLPVFTNPSGLTTDDMARVTREMNFSDGTQDSGSHRLPYRCLAAGRDGSARRDRQLGHMASAHPSDDA